MNEQEHSSQLSALFDGELPMEQSELVIRRAMKDPQLRFTWGRYALIGAAMRNEPLAVHTRLRDDVAARVAARLSSESPVAATPAARGAQRENRFQFARGAWGMAIAASVAVVSLLVVRNQAPQAAPGAILAANLPAETLVAPAALDAVAGGAAPAATAEEPLPGYTTPVSDGTNAQPSNALLVNYVVAHSETTSAVRFSPLSSVMSAGSDLAQGTVEMTEAEIGAHR